MTRRIHVLLHELGVNATYRGYSQTTAAVLLAAKDEDALLQITKRLYAEVGKTYGASFQSVERNINTVIHVAWQRNLPLLEKVIGTPLPKPPSPSQFISSLLDYSQKM